MNKTSLLALFISIRLRPEELVRS